MSIICFPIQTSQAKLWWEQCSSHDHLPFYSWYDCFYEDYNIFNSAVVLNIVLVSAELYYYSQVNSACKQGLLLAGCKKRSHRGLSFFTHTWTGDKREQEHCSVGQTFQWIIQRFFLFPFGKVLNNPATFQVESNLPFSVTLQLLLFTQWLGEGHKHG